MKDIKEEDTIYIILGIPTNKLNQVYNTCTMKIFDDLIFKKHGGDFQLTSNFLDAISISIVGSVGHSQSGTIFQIPFM